MPAPLVRVVFSDCPWPCKEDWVWAPSDARDDSANSFDELARRIGALLRGDALPPAVPVLVSGDWGAGKTSLIARVCYAATGGWPASLECAHGPLQERSEGNVGQPVWFEAWRYEGQTVLLPALLRAIWDSLPAEEKKKPATRAALARLLWAGILAALRVGASLAAAAWAGPVGATVADGLLAPLFAGLSSEMRGLLEAARSQADDQPWQDPNDALEAELAEIVKAQGATAQQPLLVFVDDLDRCNPESAVLLLDAIRRIVLSSRRIHCRFVVALDRGVMAAAIAHKFAGVPQFDAQRYLEKIFPVSFHLGRLPENEGRRLLSRLVKRSHERRGPAATAGGRQVPSNDDDAVEGLRQALDDPLFFNPRLLKRCINRFWLALALAEQRRGDDPRQYAVDDHRLLAEWIAATERWPRLRSVLQRHEDEFWMGLLRASVSATEPRPTDGEARQLLDEPGVSAWLRKCLGTDLGRLVQLRQADERLRAVGL